MIAPRIRCAIYTRKSTEEGLEQAFNSLDAQREAGEAYIASQKSEGWTCLADRYDDGGFTGGNMERPALKRLLRDIEAGAIDCIVVYKVDRLSRSLLDFSRIIAVLDKHKVSFVSVTQQFNTTTSMGRLTLNILLSFAQFEREIISERTSDKMSASRKKGKWVGGMPMLGYDIDPKGGRLLVNVEEAERVRAIFGLYLEHESLTPTVAELNRRRWATKRWTTRDGHERGGAPFSKSRLFATLTNMTYLGKVNYKGTVYQGEHEAIITDGLWQKVQTLLKRNAKVGGKLFRNKYNALLRDLIYCTACGAPMNHTYSTGEKKLYRYYVCASVLQNGSDACAATRLPAGEMERYVVDRIRAVGKDPGLLAETIRQARLKAKDERVDLDAERRALQRELNVCGDELRGIVGDVGKDRNGRSPASARLADLQERIRLAENRMAEVNKSIEDLSAGAIDEKDVAESLASFDPVWEALAPREQVWLVHLLIERIDYNSADGTVKITFRPTGIKSLIDHQKGQKS